MKGEVPAAVHMPVRMRACVNTCMCNTYMWICGGGGVLRTRSEWECQCLVCAVST